MIRKTEAIVLNTRKFSESSLITTVFTLEYGKQSFFVKGYRSTKGKKRHSYFQPMSVVDLVFYFKEGRDLQTVTESSNQVFFRDLQTDPVRITLGLLAVEVFHRAVKEQEKDEPLFHFLRQTLIQLDRREDKLIHILVHYFLHLTGFLGFLPRDEVTKANGPVVFEMNQGVFADGILESSGSEAEVKLREFLFSDMESCTEIQFSKAAKKEMIRMLIHYYKLHVEGFREPESLRVFEEVFG